MIYAVRTTVGRENSVMASVEEKAKNKALEIKALIHPERLKGYIMVEGEEEDIKESIHSLRHAKGLIPKPVKIDEIKHFIETKKMEIHLDRGDVVEIVGGPFKGEKAKITRVDKSKAEVSVELLEVAVPILVTVSVDSVRVLEKSGGK
jgi:transcriptional antiterminator NusG